MTYIKHRKMRDVCFQVIEKDSHGDFWKIKGAWINIANGKPFHMAKGDKLTIETFFIPMQKYNDEWKEQDEIFDYEVAHAHFVTEEI